MKKMCVRTRPYVLPALVAVILTTALQAQERQKLSEVLIMVNGPWTYLSDPSATGRVLLITPLSGSSHHHDPILFSGPNATNPSPSNPLPIKKGLSTLTFVSDLANCEANSHTANESSPKAYAVHLSDPEIKKLQDNLKSDLGYAVQLPEPCYYSTLSTSRSKIDRKPIKPQTAEEPYTTWMVLHYWIDPSVPAILSTNAGTQAVDFKQLAPFPYPALSFEVWSEDIEDVECDSHSFESFKETLHLLGKSGALHVRFPIIVGGTQSATYSESGNCSDAALINREKQLKTIKNLNDDIKVVRAYAGSHNPADQPKAKDSMRDLRETLEAVWSPVPQEVKNDLDAADAVVMQVMPKNAQVDQKTHEVLEVTEEYVNRSVGHGDCRGAQINLNGTVQ